MRRAALALALLVAAAAAVLAASPEELHQRTIEFRRELRRQSVTRTLSNADLLARLEALKAEHEKDPDPKVAKSLERAEKNLKLLLAGHSLPPLEEGENEPAAQPLPVEPDRSSDPSPVLEDARLVAAPVSAADYFDRSKAHLGAPPVSAPNKTPDADLSGYLALKDAAAQRAHLLDKATKLLAALSIGDATGARAAYLTDRLHKHLLNHARREKFATLRVRAVEGRLRLAYVLKDGTAAEEDLGPIVEWTTPPAVGGGPIPGGGVRGPKDNKSAKASKSGGAAGGGGAGRRGGAARSAKRASKGGGSAFDGSRDAGSAAAGGKGRRGGRGPRDAGSDAATASASGAGAAPRAAKAGGRSKGVASLPRPSARAGRGLASGEGSGAAFSARRTTSVPLPKGFASRSVHDPVTAGSSKGGGAKSESAGAPPKIKAGKGSLPDGLSAPAAATAVAAAPAAGRAKGDATLASTGEAVPHPASMTGEDELHDAVAAHEARLPAIMAVPYRSAALGADEEPASAGVSWEVLMAALGATAIAAALLQARRAERPLAS